MYTAYEDTSFFSEIGKASFYCCFFLDVVFKEGTNFFFSGNLADTKLNDNQFWNFDIFEIIRKHKSAFSHSNKKKSHYHTLQKPTQNVTFSGRKAFARG